MANKDYNNDLNYVIVYSFHTHVHVRAKKKKAPKLAICLANAITSFVRQILHLLCAKDTTG